MLPRESQFEWRRAWIKIALATCVMYVACLAVIYALAGGVEFGSDAPTFAGYVRNPLMLLAEVPRELFGESVAAPLMPLEIAGSATAFRAFFPEFVAFRTTMALHVLIGMAIGFAVAFRQLGPPSGARTWLIAMFIAALPVGWSASVVMSQDDCVSALWSGFALLACVYSTPLFATVVVGFSIFFAKPFLAVTFLAIWICSPGERLRVAAVAAAFVGALLGFYVWRDGRLSFGDYMVAPFMGASPYGITWLFMGGIDRQWMWWVKDLSAVLTTASLLLFAWFATRRRTSVVATNVGLYSLVFTFLLGTMPEYELWCAPFVVVLLWSAAQERRWSVFALAWLHSFLGYSYKLVYGFNVRFEASGKPALKEWYIRNVGIDVQPLQITLAFATIICSLALAIMILRRDPASRVPSFGRANVGGQQPLN
jgi:hypothetical protein